MDIYLKRATAEQMLLMVKFLERHKCLTGGRLRSKEQNALSGRLWRQCANILNAVEGDPRPPLKWKRYFIAYKSRLLARIKRIKDVQEGKYTRTEPPLTALEERYAAVCGFKSPTEKPKLMLEINPLKLSNDDDHTSNDSEHFSSRDSDSEGDEKPLIYHVSKPSAVLNGGVVTTNDPDRPNHSRDNNTDIKPVIYPNEPKITLHEGVLIANNPQNLFNRHQDSDTDEKPTIASHDRVLSVNNPQNHFLSTEQVCNLDGKPVMYPNEPKITLHEGEFTINTLRNPKLIRHKSDETNELKKKDCSISKYNHLEIFGQHVGMKLQDLDETQRIIAEKIINDTIFLAETNSLTMACALDFANNLKKS